jgi:hypothetical protein
MVIVKATEEAEIEIRQAFEPEDFSSASEKFATKMGAPVEKR